MDNGSDISLIQQGRYSLPEESHSASLYSPDADALLISGTSRHRPVTLDSHYSDESCPTKTQPPSEVHRVEDTLRPIPPPRGYLALDFRPTVIKRAIAIPFTVLYIAISGCLCYGVFHDIEIWTTSNINLYMAGRFLPAAIGTLTSIHIKSTSQALRRMLPFMAMADRGKRNKGAPVRRSVKARYFPALWPNSPSTWLLLYMSFIVETIVPLKSTLLSPVVTSSRSDTDNSTESRVSLTLQLNPVIAAVLGLLYAGLAVFMLGFIAFGLGQRPTGLKSGWDPVSLADYITLFHPLRTNPSARIEHSAQPKSRESQARFRIGYWQSINPSGSEGEISYGIRDLHAPVTDIRLFDDAHSSLFRHSTIIRTFQSSAAAVILVTLIGYWISMKVIDLPIYRPYNTGSLSEAETLVNLYTSNVGPYLIMRTLSVYLSNMVRLLISNLDIQYRWVQPFADMRYIPGSAPKTILLDYLTVSPLEGLPKAWNNKHWKVFWTSVAACTSWILPLFAAAALYGDTEVDPDDATQTVSVLRASLSSLISGVALSSLYLILVAVTWPTAKRALPRRSGNLADWYRLFHASHLRHAPEFIKAASEPDVTKEEVDALLFLKKEKYVRCLYRDRWERVSGLRYRRGKWDKYWVCEKV